MYYHLTFNFCIIFVARHKINLKKNNIRKMKNNSNNFKLYHSSFKRHFSYIKHERRLASLI